MGRKIRISYDYSGYESTSNADHKYGVQLMKDCIEEMGLEVKKKDYGNFGGVLKIKSEEQFDPEEILAELNGYCKAGYDNELGGYYTFEIEENA